MATYSSRPPSKHGVPVDFAEYLNWHQRRSDPEAVVQTTQNLEGDLASSTAAMPAMHVGAHNIAADTSNENVPYSRSFGDVAELIQSGKPVPGIREIPKTLLEGQASASTAVARRKPWEQKATQDALPADQR